MHEPNPDPADGGVPDDVAVWREAQRQRLLALRAALPGAERRALAAALERRVAALLRDRVGDVRGLGVSGYWPIRSEPDLRGLLASLNGAGARVALPVVVRRHAPLAFRLWTPGTRMLRGHWNIPVPPEDAPAVEPDVVLAPLVGWDRAGYRLGYGGGYFDRTLAALRRAPLKLGVGLEAAQLATIHPQPHDIAMDAILTEARTLEAKIAG